MGLECFISAPFKRENKRKRLSELEKETDTLRKRLLTDDYQSSTVGYSQAAQIDEHDHSDVFAASSSTRSHDHPDTFLNREVATVPVVDSAVSSSRVVDSLVSTSTPRTLDGVTVSANDINNIFDLFFQEYSPVVPVVDSRLSPDTFHQQSPLLFWSIIGTACRSYAQNPTLLPALSKGITTSALLAVTASKSPLQRIQAFLLLVTWPLPDAVESDQQETTYVMAGLLLHLAQRSGLHVPSGSDEFFRAKTQNLPDIGVVRRSELWAQCVLAYQRLVNSLEAISVSLTLVGSACVKAF